MISDLRLAVRLLGRAPVFAATAVLTLALGIGANLAVFTLVDAVLLRPLPFREPDRLVMLSESHAESGQQRVGVLPGSFLDWRARSRSVEAISLVWSGPYLITNRHEPARITGAQVSPNFFTMIGVAPMLGRTFPETDRDVAGHEREIVIGYGLWQRWFGGDPNVLGRTLQVSGWVSRPIVGVMPPDFNFPGGAELWSAEPWDPAWGRGDRWRQAIARVAPDASVEMAARELRQLSTQLATEFPQTNRGWTPTVDPLADAIVGPVRPPLATMMVAVGLVFLIACVNVATLVLQRGLGRQRELAMRAALGASRMQLARQSVVEHLLLAGLGAVGGGLLAIVILQGLVAQAPASIPRLDEVALDLRVLAYLIVLAVATVALTGILPALRSSRVDATAVLRGGTGGAARRSGAGRGLVVAEVALAVVLLAGAGLMIRTIVNLQRLDLGFEPDGVVSGELMVPVGRMTDGQPRVGSRPKWDRLALFYGDVVDRIETLPGVERAALVASPVLTGRGATWFARPGIVRPVPDGSPEWRAIQRRVITPDYFDVLRLPLLRGRAFTDRDQALEFLRTGKGRVRGTAIVNRAAARQFWPGQEAIGQTLTVEGDSRADGRTVVGIVGNARDLAPDADPAPTIYVPFAESPDFAATLVVRMADARMADAAPTADMWMRLREYASILRGSSVRDANVGGGSSSMPAGSLPAAQIRAQLRSLDASLMIGEIRPLADSYAATLAPRRFVTIVLAGFAGVGLLVAGVGLYGLVATSVTRRTREFGIRVALGASWSNVRRMVLREAAVIVMLGAAIGGLAAAAAAGLLRSQLFGVDQLDAPTWLTTALILALVGLAAAWFPARRASRVDPAITLRAE